MDNVHTLAYVFSGSLPHIRPLFLPELVSADLASTRFPGLVLLAALSSSIGDLTMLVRLLVGNLIDLVDLGLTADPWTSFKAALRILYACGQTKPTHKRIAPHWFGLAASSIWRKEEGRASGGWLAVQAIATRRLDQLKGRGSTCQYAGRLLLVQSA